MTRYERDLDHVAAGFDYLMGRIESEDRLDDEQAAVAQEFVATQIKLGESVNGALDSLIGLLASLEEIGAMARPVNLQAARMRAHLERFFDASSKIQTWANRAMQTEFAPHAG